MKNRLEKAGVLGTECRLHIQRRAFQVLTSPQHGGALEIPMIQSSTGGQILKRKGYTLSYNADYKTPQWVAWELTKKETKGKEGRTNKAASAYFTQP